MQRRHGLPDRDLLGHVEVVTGPEGEFAAGPIWGAGLAVWPHSTVLRELRDSFGMLAQSPSLN